MFFTWALQKRDLNMLDSEEDALEPSFTTAMKCADLNKYSTPVLYVGTLCLSAQIYFFIHIMLSCKMFK